MVELVRTASLAVVVAAGAFSSSGFASKSSWSGNATEWVGNVTRATAECASQCVADTEGNVTSLGIWECVQKCPIRNRVLENAARGLGYVSGALGLARLLPWGLRYFWDVPSCITWGRNPAVAKYWGPASLVMSTALAGGSLAMAFLPGAAASWLGCFMSGATSLWSIAQVYKDFEELLGYKCGSPQKKALMLRDVLIKMDASLGVTARRDPGSQNTDGVSREHYDSLLTELQLLRGVQGVQWQQETDPTYLINRLDDIKRHLVAWAGR